MSLLRPAAPSALGGWGLTGAGSVHEALSSSPFSDSSSIWVQLPSGTSVALGPGEADDAVCSLPAPSSVDLGSPMRLGCRLRMDGESSSILRVSLKLMEGTSMRATLAADADGSGSWASRDVELTPAEKAAVVNWSGLTLRFTASVAVGQPPLATPASVWVSEAWLEGSFGASPSAGRRSQTQLTGAG